MICYTWHRYSGFNRILTVSRQNYHFQMGPAEQAYKYMYWSYMEKFVFSFSRSIAGPLLSGKKYMLKESACNLPGSGFAKQCTNKVALERPFLLVRNDMLAFIKPYVPHRKKYILKTWCFRASNEVILCNYSAIGTQGYIEFWMCNRPLLNSMGRVEKVNRTCMSSNK